MGDAKIVDKEVTSASSGLVYVSFGSFVKWSSMGDPGRAHPAPAPLKLEKNMIFWRKIVIFHTKYKILFFSNFRGAGAGCALPGSPMLDHFTKLPKLTYTRPEEADVTSLSSGSHILALLSKHWWLNCSTFALQSSEL
jgi:hypothetical protein